MKIDLRNPDEFSRVRKRQGESEIVGESERVRVVLYEGGFIEVYVKRNMILVVFFLSFIWLIILVFLFFNIHNNQFNLLVN